MEAQGGDAESAELPRAPGGPSANQHLGEAELVVMYRASSLARLCRLVKDMHSSGRCIGRGDRIQPDFKTSAPESLLSAWQRFVHRAHCLGGLTANQMAVRDVVLKLLSATRARAPPPHAAQSDRHTVHARTPLTQAACWQTHPNSTCKRRRRSLTSPTRANLGKIRHPPRFSGAMMVRPMGERCRSRHYLPHRASS